MNPFVSLHIHSEYSLLDGAIKIPDLVQKAKEYEMPAVAVTDHGSLASLFKLYKHCKEARIKPILGLEAYFIADAEAETKEKNAHLILLATNRKGYLNLIQLNFEAFKNQYRGRPRLDWKLLEKYSEGLIGSSACLAGMIPRALREGKKEEAKKILKRYQNIFNGNFYLEFMPDELVGPDQTEANKLLLELSKETKASCICTTDSHYLNKEDRDMHHMLISIQYKQPFAAFDQYGFECSYFRSGNEMAKLFPAFMLQNTIKIAEQCEFPDFLKPQGKLFPTFEHDEDTFEYLKKLCLEGFKEKIAQKVNIEEYKERLKKELRTIKDEKLVDYTLIVRDYTIWARQNGVIVGQGRGSAAGSLVYFLIDITKVDPIKYDLSFERFINPYRASTVDCDLDFSDRDKVKGYLVNKYGEECVATILTYGTLSPKAVVQDVARSLNLGERVGENTFALATNITKSMSGDSIDEALKLSTEFKEYCDRFPDLLSYSKRLEGLVRHASTHAAGIIISNKSLLKYIPLRLQKGEIATEFPMGELEEAGFLKVDVLGLTTLQVIGDTLNYIKKTHQGPLGKMSLNDEDTFVMLRKGRTAGVFQLASSGMRGLLKDIVVNSIDDIAAILALYRPGPLDSGFAGRYANRKKGFEKIEYLHPKLEPILKKTYGVILYQEQISEIVHKLAGFSLGEADVVRVAVSKQKPEEMAKQKEKFIEGCVKNDIKKEIAEQLFSQIENYARYSFNRAHSVSYALVAYQTAYLKCHYPVEFFTAVLNNEPPTSPQFPLYKAECKYFVNLLPPSVNDSEAKFTIQGPKEIRTGIATIKGVGEKAGTEVIRNKPYKNFIDFLLKNDLRIVNKRAILALNRIGGFDCLKMGRKLIETEYGNIAPIIRKAKKEEAKIAMTNNGFAVDFKNEKKKQIVYEFPENQEWDTSEQLQKEFEASGEYLSGHPTEAYIKKHPGIYTLKQLEEIPDKKKVKVLFAIQKLSHKLTIKKGRNEGQTIDVYLISDQSDTYEMAVFPQEQRVYKEILQGGKVISGVVQTYKGKGEEKKVSFAQGSLA